MKPLTIIKIGGKLLDDAKALRTAMLAFAALPSPKILVHGGGKRASELSQRMGIAPKMQHGRRLTDQPALEIATMVYAGLINKQLVSQLQSFDCNAMGFSGADGSLIVADKRPVGEVDFGWVGDIDRINTPLLMSLLEQGVVPVFCAITHDGNGQLLNTNADTIAAQLAAALAEHFRVSLKLCFEKEGVLADPLDDASVWKKLSFAAYREQLELGTVSAGMIPKLDNAFSAKKAKVHQVMICGHNGIEQTKGTEICL